MSVSIAASSGATHTKSGSPVFVALFFLAPLVTSALPRLTPLLLPILGSALIIASWRRGASPRQLLQPSAALALCLLLTVYVFINSLMALDQGAALVKAVVLRQSSSYLQLHVPLTWRTRGKSGEQQLRTSESCWRALSNTRIATHGCHLRDNEFHFGAPTGQPKTRHHCRWCGDENFP